MKEKKQIKPTKKTEGDNTQKTLIIIIIIDIPTYNPKTRPTILAVKETPY